jgi:hypothetical protein
MSSTPEARPRRAPRSAALALLFAAAFAATTYALRGALPGGGGHRRETRHDEERERERGEPEGNRTEIKLEHFRRHGDQYTALFLGSSRTFRGFVPEVFDRGMRERGIESRSFNFGVPGARAVEVLHLLGRIAACEPRGVELVLVDPEGLSVLIDERNFKARSVIDWHDPPTTALIAAYVLEADRGRGDERELWARHWIACAYNVTNVGRGLAWVDGWLGIAPDPELVAQTLGPRLDGYVAQGEESGELAPRARRFQQKKLQDYLRQVDEFRAAELSSDPPAPAALELFRRIEARVRALGAAPVFVAQPGLYLQEDLIHAAERGDVATLLRFDGPDRYPELYAVENRFDANHLNDAGARVFTELLARAVADAIERGEIAR